MMSRMVMARLITSMGHIIRVISRTIREMVLESFIRLMDRATKERFPMIFLKVVGLTEQLLASVTMAVGKKA